MILEGTRDRIHAEGHLEVIKAGYFLAKTAQKLRCLCLYSARFLITADVLDRMAELFWVTSELLPLRLRNFQERHNYLKKDILALLSKDILELRFGAEELKQFHGLDDHLADLIAIQDCFKTADMGQES